MAKPRSQPRRVLAAVDPCSHQAPADLAEAVLSTASAIVRSWNAELDVLHAWRAFGEATLRGHVPNHELRAYIDDEQARVHRRMAEFLASAAGLPERYEVLVVHGHATEVVPALTRQRQISLVVAGSSSLRGLIGRVFGDTSTRLARSLRCPLIIVTAPPATLPRAIALRDLR